MKIECVVTPYNLVHFTNLSEKRW